MYTEFYKSYKELSRCTKLTLSEKAILTYIMSFNEKCWSSNSTIAYELGLAVSTVKKINSNLAKKGLIQITITKNTFNVDGHTLIVNEKALEEFLQPDKKEAVQAPIIKKEPVPQPSIENKPLPIPVKQPVLTTQQRIQKENDERETGLKESMFTGYQPSITDEQKDKLFQLRKDSVYIPEASTQLSMMLLKNVPPTEIIEKIENLLAFSE